MIKKEAKFTALFRHWVLWGKNSAALGSSVFELKQTQTNSIAFSDVKEHQIDALMAVKHNSKGLLYKAPDDSRGIKPCDMFYVKQGGAYVVIRYPKFFVLIDIDVFNTEKTMNKRKSLTADDAKRIAYKVVIL